ncbi:MAG: response regulator [Candidatus Brocadiales bacterium]
MSIPNNMKDKAAKKRILLVDDEETLRLSIKQVLSEDGYEVITAPNGVEALGLVSAEGFDLVITDLRMPGLSGLQLVSKIKETDPLINSIIISAYGTTETVIEAMRLGVNDFVAKPFKVKFMKEIVNRVLNASKKASDKPGVEARHAVPLHQDARHMTPDSHKSDNILIQPKLPYFLDQPQDASSGDAFFDAVDVAEKKFILIFGSTPSNYYDEAGRYFNTSLLGTMVKTVFRTVAVPFTLHEEPDNYIHPQHIVEKINKYLCLNTKPRIPVSLFCALIDNDKGVIEYVNQGQKLFCCLLQEDSKIVTLESSLYPLNLFPDIYIEEKNSSLTSESKLILSSSDSLATMPSEDCGMRIAELFRISNSASQTPQAGQSSWRGKEVVRKIRTSLSSAIPTDKLDNDWVVMVVDLNWKSIEPKLEKIIIPASTNDFRGIVNQIENILKRFTLTPQKEHGIITAINEAIINARLFAYNNDTHHVGDVKTGDIVVQFMVMGNELIIEVFDSGCGFSVQSYKRPDFTDYQSVNGESGRGIFLVQELMDRIMIQSSNNIGTRVYMAKEVVSNGC